MYISIDQIPAGRGFVPHENLPSISFCSLPPPCQKSMATQENAITEEPVAETSEAPKNLDRMNNRMEEAVPMSSCRGYLPAPAEQA